MKYLGINLTKHVLNLYAENYKTLMKNQRRSNYTERRTVFMD